MELTVLVVATALCIAGGMLRVLRDSQWAQPITGFLAGCGIVYVWDVIQNLAALREWHSTRDLEQGAAAALVGVGAVLAGFVLGTRMQFAERVPLVWFPTRMKSYYIASALMITLGVVGYATLAYYAGGFWNLVSKPRLALDQGTIPGYVGIMTSALPLGQAVLFITSRYDRRKIARILGWVVIGGLGGWWVYVGSRGLTIFTFVCLAIGMWGTRKGGIPIIRALFGGILALVVVQFVSTHRDKFYDLSFHVDEIDWTVLLAKLGVAESPSWREEVAPSKGMEFNVVVNIVRHSEGVFDPALLFRDVATRLVPRAIWPEKRYPIAETLTPIHLAGGTTEWWIDYVERPILQGPSPTFVGAWFLAGGWPMLVLGGVGTGVVYGGVAQYLRRLSPAPGGLLLRGITMWIGFSSAVTIPLAWIYKEGLILIPLWVIGVLCERVKGGTKGGNRVRGEGLGSSIEGSGEGRRKALGR